jgi:hypothetical protein
MASFDEARVTTLDGVRLFWCGWRTTVHISAALLCTVVSFWYVVYSYSSSYTKEPVVAKVKGRPRRASTIPQRCSGADLRHRVRWSIASHNLQRASVALVNIPRHRAAHWVTRHRAAHRVKIYPGSICVKSALTRPRKLVGITVGRHVNGVQPAREGESCFLISL